MAHDPRIDEKIAKAAPFAKPILEHLRALVHETVPDVGEAIKWGMPHFTYKGKNIAGMASFKAHCAFMILGEGRQGAEGGGMGSAGKIGSLADLPSDTELAERLRVAMGRIDRGEKEAWRQAPPKPKAAIAVPQDFGAGLAANATAAQCWDGLAPSHRYEYLEWITEAKRDETRLKRINQAIEWLAEGKRRNWKYER
jgi:uncharacterized protein YdeI (YjbR/CyaY-like superfamily)